MDKQAPGDVVSPDEVNATVQQQVLKHYKFTFNPKKGDDKQGKNQRKKNRHNPEYFEEVFEKLAS